MNKINLKTMSINDSFIDVYFFCTRFINLFIKSDFTFLLINSYNNLKCFQYTYIRLLIPQLVLTFCLLIHLIKIGLLIKLVIGHIMALAFG